MNYTGKIIILAFPDTFVQYSDEPSVKFLLALGLGKDNYIKAGHAAFVLIENKTGNAEYYDFGRYITPKGRGRVRSAVTDVELEIPFKAIITSDSKLSNIEDFLLWLEANPKKTHGEGRLVASVCDYIDYEKAKKYILSIQDMGSIPYKAFGKIGSNCSRIVTDTILKSTDLIKIKKPLLRNKLFTPSPLGNVQKGALGNPIYQVRNGNLQVYSGSILMENLTNYFDKNIPETKKDIIKKQQKKIEKSSFLSGTGSSAYFKLEESLKKNVFKITRFTEYGEEDFKGLFAAKESEFDPKQEYNFIYDSNCFYCHVEQNGSKIKLEKIKLIKGKRST
ncbi:DUF6695 family protein [Aquimarina muelleri]|uniref:Uncharacterized protein n=1 Tax=Aquimarina muelleri TaxID=279356 RepID=A0A918JW66_9FLAO|nr:DUF6695 family protein [Aquimarina muelleri]MCX2764377.1 hypothetical protein [Aquimarina muelleri]GGX21818.1 hypothetical protein GCM10007384_23900 [Aquimarina muelleri]